MSSSIAYCSLEQERGRCSCKLPTLTFSACLIIVTTAITWRYGTRGIVPVLSCLLSLVISGFTPTLLQMQNHSFQSQSEAVAEPRPQPRSAVSRGPCSLPTSQLSTVQTEQLRSCCWVLWQWVLLSRQSPWVNTVIAGRWRTPAFPWWDDKAWKHWAALCPRYINTVFFSIEAKVVSWNINDPRDIANKNATIEENLS